MQVESCGAAPFSVHKSDTQAGSKRKGKKPEMPDYFSDRKYCGNCKDYVLYLTSLDKTYCVQCGSERSSPVTGPLPRGSP